ncbi:hypothetical protein IRJ41_007266 [Triplophysa rosa]|uniref:Uncharacterized protein n=1 Tax=Triplophysa rosa TaxID=992332 RepID=A0A9W7TKX0_TRIRA|nr:hypothetical protein IRJ41_007266 [Triplophysa rosa]
MWPLCAIKNTFKLQSLTRLWTRTMLGDGAGGSAVFFSHTSCCGLNGDGELRTCNSASLCARAPWVCVTVFLSLFSHSCLVDPIPRFSIPIGLPVPGPFLSLSLSLSLTLPIFELILSSLISFIPPILICSTLAGEEEKL